MAVLIFPVFPELPVRTEYGCDTVGNPGCQNGLKKGAGSSAPMTDRRWRLRPRRAVSLPRKGYDTGRNESRQEVAGKMNKSVYNVRVVRCAEQPKEEFVCRLYSHDNWYRKMGQISWVLMILKNEQ